MNTDIFVALIGACGLIASVTVPLVMAKRTNKRVEGVHAEVRTNHGLRAGEYIEMMADVLRENREQGVKVAQVEELVTDLSRQWSDHTISDAVSFDEITERLAAIENHAQRAAAAQARRRRGDATA